MKLRADLAATKQVLAQVCADVYHNSIRLEKPIGKKKWKLKDWWSERAGPLITELKRHKDDIVQVRHSSFVLDCVFFDMQDPGKKVKWLKGILEKRGWQEDFYVAPPYNPLDASMKETARCVGRAVLAVAEHSVNLGGPLPAQYKLKTIDPCAEAEPPQWSLQNGIHTFARATFAGGTMSLVIEDTVTLHDLTLDAGDIIADLKWRWNSPLLVEVSYKQQSQQGLDPAPSRGEIRSRQKTSKGKGKGKETMSEKGKDVTKTPRRSSAFTFSVTSFYGQ